MTGLILFVILPLFLVRKVIRDTVGLDEIRLQEEICGRAKTDMEGFLLEADRETQLFSRLNQLLKRLSPGAGIDRKWAVRFRKGLRLAFPFPANEIWVFDPNLSPLLIWGTASEARSKVAPMIAFLSNLKEFARDHPDFLQRVRGGSHEPAFQRERISKIITDPTSKDVGSLMEKIMGGLWNSVANPYSYRDKFGHGRDDPDGMVCGGFYPNLSRVGSTEMAFGLFRKRNGEPLGGFLVSFESARIPPSWPLMRASKRAKEKDLRRTWRPNHLGRPERRWFETSSGRHWVDVPHQLPEWHIVVSVPKENLVHPTRRFLPLLDFILLAWSGIFLVFGFMSFLNDAALPLRISGQLNAALLTATLIPFIGFAMVGFSFISTKLVFSRRESLLSLESGLREVEEAYRSFRMVALKRFRKIRDSLAKMTRSRKKMAEFMEQAYKAKFVNQYYLRIADEEAIVSVDSRDSERNGEALMKSVVDPLFQKSVPEESKEEPLRPGIRKVDRASLKAEMFKELIGTNHFFGLMAEMNLLKKVHFGISNPVYSFVDFIRPDPPPAPPAGIVFLTLTTEILLGDFLNGVLASTEGAVHRARQEGEAFRGLASTEGAMPGGLERAPQQSRSQGVSLIGNLDSLLCWGYGTAYTWKRPLNWKDSPTDQELYDQAVAGNCFASRDEFDKPGGGFLGALPLRDGNFIIFGRRSGDGIRSEIQALKFKIVVLLAYAFGIGFGMSLFLSRRFSEPLLALKEAAVSIEKDDLDIRVEISTDDEFGELAAGFNRMTMGLRERARMSRFVSANLLETVRREEAGEFQPAMRICVTVLFSDIRNFTGISESNDAGEIVDLLNDYFTAMEKPIVSSGGDIDKYIGDAVMAVFRPRQGEAGGEHAVRACRAALGMRAALEEFNRDRERKGLFPIRNGIGINSGECISGHVGSRHGRLDNTVIGDVVNLASRLESESKRGRYSNVMVSESTRDFLGGVATVEFLDKVPIKGKSAPVALYELVSMEPEPLSG